MNNLTMNKDNKDIPSAEELIIKMVLQFDGQTQTKTAEEFRSEMDDIDLQCHNTLIACMIKFAQMHAKVIMAENNYSEAAIIDRLSNIK